MPIYVYEQSIKNREDLKKHAKEVEMQKAAQRLAESKIFPGSEVTICIPPNVTASAIVVEINTKAVIVKTKNLLDGISEVRAVPLIVSPKWSFNNRIKFPLPNRKCVHCNKDLPDNSVFRKMACTGGCRIAAYREREEYRRKFADGTVIAELWQAAIGELDPRKKGTHLEQMMLALWCSIPGFENTKVNSRTSDEEIDLVVINQSQDEFWKKESSIFLIECKNWITKVNPKEIDRFFQKIERRRGRCSLGFFIAPEGFTVGVETTLLANRREDKLIVLVDKEDLQNLARAASPASRSQMLKDLVIRALVGP